MPGLVPPEFSKGAGHLSLKLLRAEIEGGQDVALFAKFLRKHSQLFYVLIKNKSPVFTEDFHF